MKLVQNFNGIRQWTLDDQDYMQSAYVECFRGLVRSLTGGATTMILNGLERTGSSGNYNYSLGYIAHEEILYRCIGWLGTEINPYVNIVTAPGQYDPIAYEDDNHQTYFDSYIELSTTAGTNNVGRLNDLKRYNNASSWQLVQPSPSTVQVFDTETVTSFKQTFKRTSDNNVIYSFEVVYTHGSSVGGAIFMYIPIPLQGDSVATETSSCSFVNNGSKSCSGTVKRLASNPQFLRVMSNFVMDGTVTLMGQIIYQGA